MDATTAESGPGESSWALLGLYALLTQKWSH